MNMTCSIRCQLMPLNASYFFTERILIFHHYLHNSYYKTKVFFLFRHVILLKVAKLVVLVMASFGIFCLHLYNVINYSSWEKCCFPEKDASHNKP